MNRFIKVMRDIKKLKSLYFNVYWLEQPGIYADYALLDPSQAEFLKRSYEKVEFIY